MPIMVENDVIRIGLSRKEAALITAWCGGSFLLELDFVGKFDDENTMFAHQPDQSDESHLAINIHRNLPEKHRNQGAKHSQRYGSENDERVAQTFILCSKHEKNDDNGKCKSQRQKRSLPV